MKPPSPRLPAPQAGPASLSHPLPRGAPRSSTAPRLSGFAPVAPSTGMPFPPLTARLAPTGFHITSSRRPSLICLSNP